MQSNLLKIDAVPGQALRQMAVAGHLYAVLDACDTPAIPTRARTLGEDQIVSLYRGMAEEDYWSFAPYLARVDPELLDWIITTLRQELWGIFLLTRDTLPALRTHLRHFLIVDDPEGKEMYFRFYDPRVLRKFLPTCTARELRQLYGTVEAFLIGDAGEAEEVTRIARVEGGGTPQPTAYRIGQRYTIRAEQMAAFMAEAEAAFEGRVIAHLRDHHTALVRDFPDHLLLPMVRTGLARARHYGLTWESNLIAYVALMFEIAPNWDAHPRIQMILSSTQIPPEEKVRTLIARTAEQVWQEVAHRYDAKAWFQPVKEAI